MFHWTISFNIHLAVPATYSIKTLLKSYRKSCFPLIACQNKKSPFYVKHLFSKLYSCDVTRVQIRPLNRTLVTSLKESITIQRIFNGISNSNASFYKYKRKMWLFYCFVWPKFRLPHSESKYLPINRCQVIAKHFNTGLQ